MLQRGLGVGKLSKVVPAILGLAGKLTWADMWRRLQSAGSRLISTSRAEKSLGAAGRSACATKTGSWQIPRLQEFGRLVSALAPRSDALDHR
jgi:hypothetical protein